MLFPLMNASHAIHEGSGRREPADVPLESSDEWVARLLGDGWHRHDWRKPHGRGKSLMKKARRGT